MEPAPYTWPCAGRSSPSVCLAIFCHLLPGPSLCLLWGSGHRLVGLQGTELAAAAHRGDEQLLRTEASPGGGGRALTPTQMEWGWNVKVVAMSGYKRDWDP